MTTRQAVNCLSLVIAGTASALASAGTAQDAPRPELRVSGGMEVSSNPFLLPEGAEEGVGVYISVDPSIFLEEGRNTTVLDGSLRATQFLNNYGTDASGSLGLRTERGLSERTRLNLGATIISSRRSFQDGLVGADDNLGATDPNELPEPPVVDPTLVGELFRSTTISATAGIEHQLSPTSSLSANAALSRTDLSNNFGFDTSSASASVGYGRQISPQTVLSLTGQLASFDFSANAPEFSGDELGDTRVYSIRPGIETQIGSRWRLALNGGVDVVDSDFGSAGGDTSTLLSGSLSLCNTGLRSSFCVTGQRAAQPLAIGGVATVLSAGVTYRLEISQDDRVNFRSQFGRTDQSFEEGFQAGITEINIFGVNGSYTRDLSNRTALNVTIGYTDVSDNLRDVPSNVFARVGITLAFGRRR
jgi:hypothetical protein